MNSKLSLDQVVQRQDHAVWKVIEGKGILLNLEDGAYFELNSVALAIWEKCDGKTPLKAIISSLEEAYPENVQSLTNDVTEFVDALESNQMVEIL